VRARFLFLLRDPGPKTQEGRGSGYLCLENDDQSAEYQARSFEAVGILASDTMPWNAYPWYINRRPTAMEREAGVEPLIRLMALMPELRVVLLQGRDAQDVWRRLLRRCPDFVHDRDLQVVPTYHPSRQALRSPDEAVRRQRQEDRRLAFEKVADLLHRQSSPA
jgi:uracil-DNA glycosylase